MSQNLITLEVSDEQLAAAYEALGQLEVVLAGLVSLSPDDRRRLAKMGPKSETFCRQAVRVLEQNPMLELDEDAVATTGDGEEVDPAGAAALDRASIETAAFDELPESSMWDVAGASWSGEGEDRLQRIAEPGSSDPCVRALQRLALELDARQLDIAGYWLEHCDEAGYLVGDHAALLLRACARFDVAADRIEAVRQRLNPLQLRVACSQTS